MSIQSWKWRNIISTCQFIIFSGNYSARSSQNALQWVNCRNLTRFPDPLWRHPSYGQVGCPSNLELDGNSRMSSGHSRRTTELDRVEWQTTERYHRWRHELSSLIHQFFIRKQILLNLTPVFFAFFDTQKFYSSETLIIILPPKY
jgi:hypothetical protein